jgi:hypothetical protein
MNKHERKPAMLAVIAEVLHNELAEEADELAVLVVERLADAGYLTDEQVKDCGLYRIVAAA